MSVTLSQLRLDFRHYRIVNPIADYQVSLWVDNYYPLLKDIRIKRPGCWDFEDFDRVIGMTAYLKSPYGDYICYLITTYYCPNVDDRWFSVVAGCFKDRTIIKARPKIRYFQQLMNLYIEFWKDLSKYMLDKIVLVDWLHYEHDYDYRSAVRECIEKSIHDYSNPLHPANKWLNKGLERERGVDLYMDVLYLHYYDFTNDSDSEVDKIIQMVTKMKKLDVQEEEGGEDTSDSKRIKE
jgi:hypothetical protein